MDFFHTEGSGWFPACGLDQKPQTGRGTSFPVPMTVEAAMQNYWLVRDWDVRVRHGLIATIGQGSPIDVQRYEELQPTVVTWSSWSSGSEQPVDSVCPQPRQINIGFSGVTLTTLFDGSSQNGTYSRYISFGFLYAPQLGVGSWFWSDPGSESIWPNMKVSGTMDSSSGSFSGDAALAATSSFVLGGQSIPITFYDPDPYAGGSRTGGTQATLLPRYF